MTTTTNPLQTPGSTTERHLSHPREKGWKDLFSLSTRAHVFPSSGIIPETFLAPASTLTDHPSTSTSSAGLGQGHLDSYQFNSIPYHNHIHSHFPHSRTDQREIAQRETKESLGVFRWNPPPLNRLGRARFRVKVNPLFLSLKSQGNRKTTTGVCLSVRLSLSSQPTSIPRSK